MCLLEKLLFPPITNSVHTNHGRGSEWLFFLLVAFTESSDIVILPDAGLRRIVALSGTSGESDGFSRACTGLYCDAGASLCVAAALSQGGGSVADAGPALRQCSARVCFLTLWLRDGMRLQTLQSDRDVSYLVIMCGATVPYQLHLAGCERPRGEDYLRSIRPHPVPRGWAWSAKRVTEEDINRWANSKRWWALKTTHVLIYRAKQNAVYAFF